MTDKEHLDKLLDLLVLLDKVVTMRGMSRAYDDDVIGVRGFTKDLANWSFDDVKSGWCVDDENRKVYRLGWLKDSMRRHYAILGDDAYDKFSSDELKLIERLSSIQYAKKKRQIWYNDWTNSCPRFDIKEVEALLCAKLTASAQR